MKTKFTKGEWKILQGKSQRDVFESGRLLATAYNNTVSKQNICLEEAIANAKLIAAAPELLEACVYLVRLKDLVLPPEPVKGVSEEFMSKFIALNNLIKMADSAIKKATE